MRLLPSLARVGSIDISEMRLFLHLPPHPTTKFPECEQSMMVWLLERSPGQTVIITVTEMATQLSKSLTTTIHHCVITECPTRRGVISFCNHDCHSVPFLTRIFIYYVAKCVSTCLQCIEQRNRLLKLGFCFIPPPYVCMRTYRVICYSYSDQPKSH